MKAHIKIYFLFLAIIFTGCAAYDQPSGENPSTAQDSDTAFLRLLITPPPTVTTRDNEKWWQEGTEEENTISKVRFYFFDEQGDNVNVTYDESTSNRRCYVDISKLNDVADVSLPDAEKAYAVDLQLQLEGGKRPAQVVAIINPPLSVFKENEYVTPTLGDLEGIIEDFQSNLISSGSFVMSNSTYVAGTLNQDDRKICCAVPISESELYFSETEFKTAKGGSDGSGVNAVTIYVERVVARLDLHFDSNLNGNSYRYKVFQPNSNDGLKIKLEGEGNDKEVYVEFMGWAVTSTPTKSRLLKKVDKSWDESKFFGSNNKWTYPGYHRSFWALNPDLKEMDYQWFSYFDITGISIGDDGKETKDNKLSDGCNAMSVESVYMQENANPCDGILRDPVYPSKVICAGRLVDADGKAIEIAEYDSKYYSLDGLRNLIAGSLNMHSKSEVNKDGQKSDVYTKIKPEDLVLETSIQHKKATVPDNAEDTYNVYFSVSGSEWYSMSYDSEGKVVYEKIKDVKSYMDSRLFPAKVWRNGYTYYFFDIPHFGEKPGDPGYYGVVRNHIYDATVKTITSLGTPVYDPSETIYPELPPKEGNKLEITIKVTQWRFVNKHLQLAW